MKPLEALQATLAGEHAAVYVYAVLGARVSRTGRPTLFAHLDQAYRAHRRNRDQLAAMIVRRGGDPVAAEVSYELPANLRTAAQTQQAALQMERRLAAIYGQLTGGTSGADRRWALAALDECAVRQLSFRGSPEMFPGMT